jgi:MerR family transcriptional regulator, heat shock protein HspR
VADLPGATGAPAPDHGVYGISVAAELSGIPVQSLRLYERCGPLTPARSDGGTRRYSADDLARLRRISMLVEAGVNLAGVARILDLEDDNVALSATNTDLRSTNRTLRKAAQAGANDDADGSREGPALSIRLRSALCQ